VIVVADPLAAGHGVVQGIAPLIATAVSALFCARLAARYTRRRRAYDGVWAAAMLMFALASAAVLLGVVTGWTALEFRVYWLFGAILTVPYLFAGEVYLLSPGRAGDIVLAVVVALSLFATIEVWASRVSPVALQATLPLGKDVFGTGSTAYRLAQVLAFPAYFLLLGGLVWSAWRTRNRKDLRHVTVGTLLIALGATIVAIGSGVGAGLHVVWLFSISLAVGVLAMYGGFVRASAPRPAG
jgi:MFS family permease